MVITDCIRKGEFYWIAAASWAFQTIKERMTSTLVLCLPDFTKVFEVMCDASGLEIGGTLNQEGHSIAFFSENINDAKLKYSTYDKELYVVV